MATTVQDLLDQILNARYGEEVRSAIHDSIEQCYTDTVSGVNAATAAASSAVSIAETAASSAYSAMNAANEAASSAREATENAETEATRASSAADRANASAEIIEDVIASATNATESVQTALTSLNETIIATNSAKDTALEKATAASTAASRANAAADSAVVAINNVTTALTNVNTAVNDANTAAADARTAKSQCDTVVASAQTAITRVDLASAAIENLTVSSENVGPTQSASATVEDVSGHKHIHFVLKQGDQGAAFKILGSAYASVSDLIEDITDPAVGDQYNVGQQPPYHVWRWTGNTEAGTSGWEDEGEFGSTISNLTNNEINTLWGGTPIQSDTSKYINHSGLFHLIYEKIVAALGTKVDKVTGKGLSTYDFDSTYRSKVNNNEAAISTLQSGKVDKETGKGLSTNDFSSSYRTMLTRDYTLIGSSTLETTAQTLTGAINELKSTIDALGSLTASNISTTGGSNVQTVLNNLTSTVSSNSGSISTNQTNITTINTKLGKLVVASASSSDFSMTNYKELSFSVAKSGYTPLAIAGYIITGTGSSFIFPYVCRLDGSTAKVNLRKYNYESGDSATTNGVTLYVLYKWV